MEDRSKLREGLNEAVDITKYGDFYGMRFGQKVRLVNPGRKDNGSVYNRFVGYEFEGRKDPSVALIQLLEKGSIRKSKIEREDCASGRFGSTGGLIREEDQAYDFYKRIWDGAFVE